MRSRSVLPCLACVAIGVLGTSTLRAQGLSVFAEGSGSSIFNKRDIDSASGSTFTKYQPGEGFTLGAETSFVRILGVEASYYLGRNNLEVFSPNETHGIRQQRASLDLVLHAPTSIMRMRPYLAVGPELDHLTVMGGSAPTQTFAGYFTGFSANNKFGINYGGGVDLKLALHLSLRLDVRNHTFSSPTYGLPAYIYPPGGHAENLVYSLGLVFRFGK